MCKKMHIAFFVVSHTFPKFQALEKLMTQYFYQKYSFILQE